MVPDRSGDTEFPSTALAFSVSRRFAPSAYRPHVADTDVDIHSLIAVIATDVEFRILGDGRFEIAAGGRRSVAVGDPAQVHALSRVMHEILPRLRRSVPLGEQLPEDDLARLRPFLKQLLSLGVLLTPAGGVETDEDLRLYSFISRRTDRPDETFAAVKTRRVDVYGPAEVTGAWAPLLAAQGIVLGAVGEDDGAAGDGPAALTIVAATDEARLRSANRRLCASRRSWVPVLLTPDRIRIGPWTMPGESACLRCLPSTETETAPASVPAGWLTFQPGCLGWAAGLITHLTLRAFVPLGGEHPWGTVVSLDAVGCGQRTVRAWRDPYCDDCAEHVPATLSWAAV